MKISDKQFVNQLLAWDNNTNEMIHYFQVCEKLLKKHWRAIFTSAYLENVQKASTIVYEVLLILKQTNKDNALSIKNIIKNLKETAKDYKPEFTIKSDSMDHNNALASHIKESFQESTIINDNASQDDVKISGEWRYYKRWFEQDIKKLLELN